MTPAKRSFMTILAIPFLISGCATVGTTPPQMIGKVMLQSSAGLDAGTAQIMADRNRVTLRVTAATLPAGPHGIHLHMVGQCAAPAFTSAGGHLNPGGHQHGSENPAGSHLGDLPNLMAGPDGTGTLTIELRGTPAELEAALFDADGSALVIHAAADDYRTDPTGNSGARIACGIVLRA